MSLLDDGLAAVAPEIGVPLKIWRLAKPFLPYIAIGILLTVLFLLFRATGILHMPTDPPRIEGKP